MKSTDPSCAEGATEVSVRREAKGVAEPLCQAVEKRVTLLASLASPLQAEMPRPVADACGDATTTSVVLSSHGGAYSDGVSSIDGTGIDVPSGVPDLSGPVLMSRLTATTVEESSRLIDGYHTNDGGDAPLMFVVEEGEGSLLGRVTILEAPTEEVFLEVSRDWLTGSINPRAIAIAQEMEQGRDGPQRRQRRSRTSSEFLRAEDVARILPLSVRQVQAMAAEGSLPGMKVPGCDVWMFEETAIRALLTKRRDVAETEGKTRICRRSSPRSSTPTETSTAATMSGTSATNLADAASSSPLGRLMSARRGRSAIKS